MDTPDAIVPLLARSKLARSIGATVAAGLVSFVSTSEGTSYATYYDPVNIVTACTGHTGPELRIGQTFTKSQCDEMLQGDLLSASNGVRGCVEVALNSNQLAAFTSFAFNVGVKAFCESTMVTLLNGGDYPGACAQLSRWVYAKGQRLPGLVRRRAAERALCEKGIAI